MSRGRAVFVALALLGPLSAAAAAQTLIEHALITAGSAGAAAAGKGVGKSVGSVFDKMKTVLDQAGKPGASLASQGSVIQSTIPAGDAPKPSTVCADNPAKIAVGLAYDEVLARCGVPAFKTNTGSDGLRLWFAAKDKETVVTLAAGKVSAIDSRQQKPNDGIVVVQ